MAPDPRTVVGSFIRAKACHVTSHAECRRLYGSNWNTKMVRGTVIRAFQQSSVTIRRYWYVVANYELTLDKRKEKELQVRSVVEDTPILVTTETTTQDPVAAQPSISTVAAAAAAATTIEMAQLHQQQQQMPQLLATAPVLLLLVSLLLL